MSDDMAWIINPGKAIGPLALGMSRHDCIALLGNDFDEFKRTPDAEEITLAFDLESVHVSVDSNGQVKSVSVFRPRDVSLNNVPLLDEELLSVSNALLATGVKVQSVDAGLWCQAEGILLVDVEGRIDGVELAL